MNGQCDTISVYPSFQTSRRTTPRLNRASSASLSNHTFSAGEKRKRKRNEDAAQLAERMRDRLQERDIDDIARNRTRRGFN